MKLFWYSLRFPCNDEVELDSPPQVSHGAVDVALNRSGEYILDGNVCGVYSLGKPDFDVPIRRDGYIVFFSDISEDDAYRLLQEYISLLIKRWNSALVALENTRNFKHMDFGLHINSATWKDE